MQRFLAVALFCSTVCTMASADDLSTNGIFIFNAGTFTAISNTSADTPIGIDNAGQLLLATDGSNGSPVLLSPDGTVAFLTVPGSTTLVTSLSAGGTILGRYITNTSTYFTERGATFTNLTNAPGFLQFSNDQGQIIGVTFDGMTNIVYNSRTGSVTPITFPGATFNRLISINDNGEILGRADSLNYIDANGKFTFFTLPSTCTPTAFNDHDQVVGDCFTAPNGGGHLEGFLYSGGTLQFLDYTGNHDVNNSFLTGINDSGQIIGAYSDVPEPDTLTTMTAGLGCLILCSLMYTYVLRRKTITSNPSDLVVLSLGNSRPSGNPRFSRGYGL
jgi:hypothetical protein